jgi:hypothetical protein
MVNLHAGSGQNKDKKVLIRANSLLIQSVVVSDPGVLLEKRFEILSADSDGTLAECPVRL